MSIPKETKERINILFKTNPEMIEKLYKYDEEAMEDFREEELILMRL